eukprot:gene18850-25402_t
MQVVAVLGQGGKSQGVMDAHGAPAVMTLLGRRCARSVVKHHMDMEVDISAMGVAGAKRLEWVPASKLRDHRYVAEDFHRFAAEMLETMVQDCNLLDRLADFLDCAAKSCQEEDSVALIGSTESFDVIDALRQCALACALACGTGSSSLPLSPSWTQVSAAVNTLPKKDRMKLQRRFHPDRLARNLGRDPSQLEKQKATAAMKIINLLFEQPPNKTAMEVVKELEGLKDVNGVSELEEMLANARIDNSRRR